MSEYSKVCGTREDLERFADSLAGDAKPCRIRLRKLAAPSRGGGRYGPLRDYLAGRNTNVAAMTFADIEALVGELPASAPAHRPWWANSTNTQARAWRDAGWRVQSVDLAGEQAVFARDNTRLAGTNQSTAVATTAYIDADVATAVAARAEELGLRADKLRSLIQELNDNYGRGNTYATHALLRTILDHIPPLLGCREFQQLLNNRRWTRGDASFVRRLDAFRLQANDALHRTISRKADLLVIDDVPPRLWINRLRMLCTHALSPAAAVAARQCLGTGISGSASARNVPDWVRAAARGVSGARLACVSLLVGTWVGAIATVILAVGAIITAVYAVKAFRGQAAALGRCSSKR